MKEFKEIVLKACEEQNVEFYDIEQEKQGQTKVIRVMADTPEGITINQCVDLNRLLCEMVPEDLIAGEYVLEVSSPGAERKLRNLKDVEASVGKYVFVKLYEKIEGQKEFFGDLEAVNGDIVVVAGVEVPFDKIATIRWAIKF